MSTERDIIDTDSELKSSGSGNGGIETIDDNLGPIDSALTRLEQWVNSIIELTSNMGSEWDIRPDLYDPDLEPLYTTDIVDINKLMAKALRYWRIHISQTGPDVYAITLGPIKPLVRGLMSGGASPEEAIVNVVFRYLNEVGTERLKE